jgi:hypothetical protein
LRSDAKINVRANQFAGALAVAPYFGSGATPNNTGLLTNTGHLVVDACRGPGTGGDATEFPSLDVTSG